MSLRLRLAVDGRRRFKGVVTAVEDETLLLSVDNKVVRIPVDSIDKGNLEPRYDDILRAHAAQLGEPE